MPHGVQHLFNGLAAATAAFGSGVPLSIRKAWDNETVFTVALVSLGLLPVALVLFAPLYFR